MARVLPYANCEAMNLHLGEIGCAVRPGAHALLVLDGAGWHTSPTLAVPDNITLVCLPAYAPELNPVENIWEYLRKKQARHTGLRYLRRHRRCLLQGLERPPRNTRQTRLHNQPRVGYRVINSVGWY